MQTLGPQTAVESLFFPPPCVCPCVITNPVKCMRNYAYVMRSNCYLRGRGLHGAAMRDVFCVTLSARALSDPVIMDNLKLSRRAAECFPHTAFQRPPRPSSPSPLTASSVNCTPVKLLTLFCFLDISRARLLVLHLHQKKKKGNDSQTSESNFPSPSFPPAKCFTVISDSRSIQAVISNAAD